MEDSMGQKPDTILRKRTRQGYRMAYEDASIRRTVQDPHQTMDNGNRFVKLAVWTLTLSMGAMTFLVLNAAKKWI